ncbi:PQQ-binding-like beta-propeller repeat protein [Actinomyces oris]|uniref:PQQ-binding-like beta-propeller repeat protein n=1 Tax=Actinomyces oris TaxID=544580 RepID=UPI00094C7F91|nr:PQQ-binding-like beta-propeller repeat protein [Actinomyces oris]OLO54070.1 MFS transporter [Actinomyces oris]OLO59234.1 MFS transporter [Actinomyces oris]
MPPTPDADTDDNGTDQPGTNPSTQPGAAGSGDAPSSEPDTGEAEDSADRDATEADQAATADSEDETEGKSEGEPFPPRGALALRALRWGGLIGALVLAATALTLCRGLIGAGVLVPSEVSALPRYIIVGGLLVWPSLNFRKKKRPVLVTIMTTIMAALGVTTSASLTLAWWDTYQETGFSVLFLLALAGVALSATLFLSAGTLLHYLRSAVVGVGDDEDPSRWGHLRRKTGEKTDKGLPRYERIRVPRRTRAYLTAMVIAPALTLGSAIAGTWALINPVHHVTATAPANSSLTPPTSLAPKASWSKEISSSKLTTVAGAGGPILLTDDSIVALNPKDGSVLWSYSRKRATFATSSSSPNNHQLITSPDGKYVALRILSPEFVDSVGDTLVFDALTGRIVFERQSTGGPLQLTDSAILDGNSAFSLTDGKKLWTLSDGDRVDYSGTAGHSSFILDQYSEDQRHENSPQSYKSTITLRVTPQEDLSAAVEVDDVLANPPDYYDYPPNPGSFIQGWAARYTGEFDSSGNPVAEAISLDALAKVDGTDTKTFPLGATSGINTAASLSSGSIVTYSPIRLDNGPRNFPSEPRTEKVFDPPTLTVSSIAQYPGFTGSPAEFVDIPADDGSLSAAITVRPGDGSAGTTIPITPGFTDLPPTLLASSTRDGAAERAQAMRAPGAVIAIFNATRDTERDCTRGKYDQSKRCPHTYRIYGITGEQK